MVEPVAFFVALDFCKRSLVCSESRLGFDHEGLLLSFDSDLALALVSILVLLFTQNFTSALVL